MNIIVLAGGISTEREVSLSSGSNVYKALKKKGHKVAMVDVYLGIEDEEIAANPAHILRWIRTGQRMCRQSGRRIRILRR